jgi:hypothetical protein
MEWRRVHPATSSEETRNENKKTKRNLFYSKHCFIQWISQRELMEEVLP